MEKYTIVYHKEEDAFVGHCLELPDAFSYGSTLDELKINMQEVIELVQEYDMKHKIENKNRKQAIQITI